MGSRKYALEKGGQTRFEISWDGSPSNCKNIIIRLDGKEIGSIPDRKAALAGYAFTLQDNSILKVNLNPNGWQEFMGICDWRIYLNGELLPVSDFDAIQKHKAAYQAVYAIAGFNLAIGLTLVLFKVNIEIFDGTSMMVSGFIFLVLGFFVQRKSAIALGIALAIFLLDTLTIVYFLISNVARSTTPPITGFIIRTLIIYYMWQGLGAIRTLKNRNQISS